MMLKAERKRKVKNDLKEDSLSLLMPIYYNDNA